MCKQHKWKIIRETSIRFPNKNGTHGNNYRHWQTRECSICKSTQGRWKPL